MKLEQNAQAPLFSNTQIPDIFFQNIYLLQMEITLKYIYIFYFYLNMIKI